MVVKAKRGRRRYIAFLVIGEKVSEEKMITALTSSFSSKGIHPPKVIQFDGRKGIIRTSDKEKERAVEAINSPSNGIALKTLRASGTVRTLRERYFESCSQEEEQE